MSNADLSVHRQDYATVEERPRRAIHLPRLRWPALVVAAVAGVAIAGLLAVINSPLLEVQAVEVTGTRTLSGESLAQLAGLRGENVLLANLGAARRRILSQPLVQDASVERVWPNGVRVTVVERTPWARWEVDGTAWAIDDEGVVLEGLEAPEEGFVVRQVSSLPVIRAGARVDVDAVRLIRTLAERGAPLTGVRLLGFEWSLRDGLTVVTQFGRITFGDSDGLAFKYEVWEALEQEALRRGEPLLAADLRFGTHPHVEMGLGLGRATRIVEP